MTEGETLDRSKDGGGAQAGKTRGANVKKRSGEWEWTSREGGGKDNVQGKETGKGCYRNMNVSRYFVMVGHGK